MENEAIIGFVIAFLSLIGGLIIYFIFKNEIASFLTFALSVIFSLIAMYIGEN